MSGEQTDHDKHFCGPIGSGGALTDDHVICPGCAHNFAAISQSSRDRIAELETAIRNATVMADHGVHGELYAADVCDEIHRVLTAVVPIR